MSCTSRYPTLRVMSHRYVSTHTFTPHPQTHENESCDTCIYATPSESCVLCPHTSSQCTIRHIRMIHVTHISMPHPPSHVTNVYVLIYSHTHPPNIQPTQKEGSYHTFLHTPPSESWHKCTCPPIMFAPHPQNESCHTNLYPSLRVIAKTYVSKNTSAPQPQT